MITRHMRTHAAVHQQQQQQRRLSPSGTGSALESDGANRSVVGQRNKSQQVRRQLASGQQIGRTILDEADDNDESFGYHRIDDSVDHNNNETSNGGDIVAVDRRRRSELFVGELESSNSSAAAASNSFAEEANR